MPEASRCSDLWARIEADPHHAPLVLVPATLDLQVRDVVLIAGGRRGESHTELLARAHEDPSRVVWSQKCIEFPVAVQHAQWLGDPIPVPPTKFQTAQSAPWNVYKGLGGQLPRELELVFERREARVRLW